VNLYPLVAAFASIAVAGFYLSATSLQPSNRRRYWYGITIVVFFGGLTVLIVTAANRSHNPALWYGHGCRDAPSWASGC
jgi:hypothetical protein